MTVQYLLRNISSSELTEWMAFYSVEAEPEPEKKINTPEVLRAMFAHRVKKGK